MRVRFLIFSQAVIFGFLSLVSCDFSANSSGSHDTVSGSPGLPKIFRAEIQDYIKTLDPLWVSNESERRISDALYSSLFRLAEDGRIYPELADEFEEKENGLFWIIHLRTDVRFAPHEEFSERRLSAEDAVMSLRRAWMSPESSPAASVLRRIVESADDDIQKESLYSFSVKLRFPYSGFRELMARPSLSVVRSELIRETKLDGISGSGAFMLQSKESDRIVLVPNPFYFEEPGNVRLPYLSELHFLRVPENSSVLFRDRKLEWCFSAPEDSTLEVKELKLPSLYTVTLRFPKKDSLPSEHPYKRGWLRERLADFAGASLALDTLPYMSKGWQKWFESDTLPFTAEELTFSEAQKLCEDLRAYDLAAGFKIEEDEDSNAGAVLCRTELTGTDSIFRMLALDSLFSPNRLKDYFQEGKAHRLAAEFKEECPVRVLSSDTAWVYVQPYVIGLRPNRFGQLRFEELDFYFPEEDTEP